MKKKLFKAVAASAAVCFMAGLVLVNGGTDSKAAPGDYLINANFDDGDIPKGISSSCTLELIEGMNSNYDAVLANSDAPDDTNGSCIKVTKRNGYWEISGLSFDVSSYEVGSKHDISFDIYHENDATDTWNSNRAVVIKGMPDYQHIEGAYASPMGDWERISFTYEHKQRDINGDGTLEPIPEILHVEFAYPEAYEDNGGRFLVENKEEYYIDNVSIKEYVEPTAKPTEAPTPTPAVSTPAPTTAPVVTEAPIVVPTDDGKSGFDAGYEETIKGITYIVNADDTVTVAGIESAKSKLVIPNTVTFEDGSVFNVTAIKANAFKGETAIKNLTIGSNITSIGKNAFAKCKNIKKVTIKSSAVKTIGKGAFKTIKKKATISVPKAKKAAYKKLLKKSGLPKGAKVK